MSFEEACLKEIELIKTYKSTDTKYGYNISSGGQGCSNPYENKTDKEKQLIYKKISNANKGKLSGNKNPMYGKRGKLHPFYGKHHSEETKSKLKNKTVTSQTKAKMSNNHANVSRSRNPKAKCILCLTTTRIFNCIQDACDKYEIKYTGIVGCAKGRYKTSGKLPDGTPLRWMYYDEYIKLSDEEKEELHNKYGFKEGN